MNGRLTVHERGDFIIIGAHGKLASPQEQGSLHQQLRQLVERGRSHILLDLAQVPSLDIEDIGELMVGYALVTLAGGELRLLNLSGSTADVLRTTRIIHLIGGAGETPDPHPPPTWQAGSEWYIG
ncbi:STAS domain-containing protein [Paludibaculum fermentans]|uniref:STAS domain-containing protein n=1 Tax=Paludibaculum fermentans TaxID=1473598 RepID=A0A7S7NS25_PALFE|nr:STAS domain-containing protein [Paludibaculum fermentans]QOY88801.1 STAS domain-containing protein [Paludibaculum fermentans]